MDSSSRDATLQHFKQMIEWRKRNSLSLIRYFNWTEYHLSVVLAYALKLSLNSDLKPLSLAKLFKDAFRRWMRKSSTEVEAGEAAYFAQDLRKFFIVPKRRQLFERDDTLKQNELVAAFINMLLLLLHSREGSIIPIEERVDRLEKEMRFLLTVLGDKSLMYDGEHEQVQILLKEIEAVASEAGRLVHAIVFSTFGDPRFRKMDKRLAVHLNHMDLLKANINKFSNLLPVLEETDTRSKTAALDSLFIIDSLIYDIEDLLNRDDGLIADVKDQIKELQQELKFLQSFIKGVRVSRPSEMEEMKEPMMRIRDVAYEAEYLINYFLAGDAPLWYFSNRLSHVIRKIKLIGIGQQEIKKNYKIGASKVADNFNAQRSTKNKRSSEVDDVIVGFEHEATDILDHLEGGKEHLQIISIFGMPGLGKTTLAKKLYNHPLLKHKFDRCSWCVVSQTYHRKYILIDILVSLRSELDKDEILKMDEENLVERIYKILKGRRYLIVMDDLWSSNTWDDLQRCFPDDRNGSRILFTSRNKDVAPPHSITYELSCMSDEQCWELLEKKMFKDKHCPPQLVKTGMQIAANCHGVPLAVVVIAGVLSSMDKEVTTWENVGGNLASYIFSDQNNSMTQILELSYKHLPDHLKPCFLYFGLFPEDTEIPVKKLKRLWMAEGFIHEEENKSAENVAEEYLVELIDKSLVTVAKRRPDGGVKTSIIHDLLRDLCLKISKDGNFLKLVEKNYSVYEKHQRLCIRSQISPPFGLHVRSLFGFPGSSVLVIINMKLLRVLDLLGYRGSLNEVKLLVHLRYLAINYEPSSMRSLEWISSLVNLEFLVVDTLDDFVHTTRIPSSVLMKMMKLRYVKFNRIFCFDNDCNSFNTNNLEFLSYVEIASLEDAEILKCSPHLRKLKCKVEPLWVQEQGKYHYLDFRFFTQLESLNLFLRPGFKMQDISLPLNIKELSLCKLGLPWEKMSIIGRLPNLQVLKLSHFAFEGEIWETRDGEFQQLTFLKLQYLDFAQWNVPLSEHFPKLQQLVLDHCENLQEIPSEVGEIAVLQLIEVIGFCQKSLAESAQQIEREQHDMDNEGLRVMFTDIYHPYMSEISSDEEMLSDGS